MADRRMEMDGWEAPALGTSVERMVAAAATGNTTEPMMAQEVDLLRLLQIDSLVVGRSGQGSSGGQVEMLCSRSASSAGSSGSGQSGRQRSYPSE